MNLKTIKPRDLVTIFVSFIAGQNGKRRPILVIRNTEKQLRFFSITSKYEQKSPRIKLQYYPLADWQIAGLQKASYIDIKSQRVVAWESLSQINYVGHLSLHDAHQLQLFILSYEKRLAEFENR